MFIQKLALQNFKRFSNLTIDISSCSTPPKLVLLIGANGSGKSSVFDAFNYTVRAHKVKGQGFDHSFYDYYKKEVNEDVKLNISFFDGDSVRISNLNVVKSHNSWKSLFFGRSSLRVVPKISNSNFNENTIIHDNDAPQKYIEYDNRFNNDVVKYTQDINKALREPIFQGESADTLKIFHEFIKPFNDSLAKIFGEDEKTSIRIAEYEEAINNKPPKLIFSKGGSKINYDLLSHGEKQVVIILLNFIVRRNQYLDTIYYIDEMDVHMNTSLQTALLKEIVETWIPDGCQLWTASHALGFIDYANDTEHSVIIDFDNLDFDEPHTIIPSEKNNFDVFEIAVNQDFLSKIFEGKKIVFAENTDTPFYNNLNIKDTIFFVAKDKKDVFYKTINGNYSGIVDRDYLTDEEVEEIKDTYPNLSLLDYYSIENYLFHPDNLEEFKKEKNVDFDKEKYIQDITEEKKKLQNRILIGVAKGRDSYPFFRNDNKFGKKLKQFQSNSDKIIPYLESETFETFYKIFPMKDYATQLPQRRNISKSELASTEWFKSKIQNLFFE